MRVHKLQIESNAAVTSTLDLKAGDRSSYLFETEGRYVVRDVGEPRATLVVTVNAP